MDKDDTQMLAFDDITDECVDEYDEIIAEEILNANSSEVKITPNTELLLERYYKKCNHTTKEYVELPQDIVNMNEEELRQEYQDWEVKKFTSEEITLYKQLDQMCNEHYMLKAKDGKIAIYRLNENGEAILDETTAISTEYLPETDLINIEEGMKVYGKEQLNKVLEDFE